MWLGERLSGDKHLGPHWILCDPGSGSSVARLAAKLGVERRNALVSWPIVSASTRQGWCRAAHLSVFRRPSSPALRAGRCARDELHPSRSFQGLRRAASPRGYVRSPPCCSPDPSRAVRRARAARHAHALLVDGRPPHASGGRTSITPCFPEPKRQPRSLSISPIGRDHHEVERMEDRGERQRSRSMPACARRSCMSECRELVPPRWCCLDGAHAACRWVA